MNPKISITVDVKNRAISSLTGIVSVGAKVDVEIAGISSSDVPNWGATDDFTGPSLRFRVVDDRGRDLVRYQLRKKTETSPDVWTWDSVNSKFTATNVDFNTDVLRRKFSCVPYDESVEFGVIIDSVVDSAEYAVGKIKIRQWSVASTENPTVLPDWREMAARIDAASASVTKVGKVATISITDTHGTTTTAQVSDGDDGEVERVLEGETMKINPSQRQMTEALKKIWQALGGTFTMCLAIAMCAFGEVTRETEWQDVSPETKIGTVVDLGRCGVTLTQVTNVANDRIDAKVAPWAMRGQPQPTGSITNVFTNGVSAVAGGVARITIPSTNGLASAGDVAAAKAQAIATASADATAKAQAAEENAKAASRPVDWMPSAEDVGALPAAKISSGFYSIEDSFETHENVYMYYGEEEFFNIMYGDYDVRGLLNKPLGKKWYYGGEEDANEIATLGDLPTPATPAFTNAFAAKATEGRVTAVSNEVAEMKGYITGDRVRISVTNYYGNTSGEPPRLRIEEFDHSTTTTVAGVSVVSNIYRTVWDEVTRQTNYYARTDAKVDGISNTVMNAAWRQTNAQLVNKAPRAWQSVTSAGEDAPQNMVWHTAPNTVFAGGTEYAHVAVGEGSICVLVDKGAPVYTEGAEGQFRFKDESGQNYFGFDVRQSYTIGCRTDGISVSPQNVVSLTYDLTSADNPEVLVCTNLTQGVWTTATVEWEQNPPVGTKICYINGAIDRGFYKAQMNYAGGAKFITNMMADLAGGIAATNETGIGTATHLPIYPAITPTGVVWRVNWGN